jgi:predicted metal-dependent hydrolase
MGRPLLKELGTRRVSVAGEVYEVCFRQSARARNTRITIAPGRPIEVVLARGMHESDGIAFLAEKRDWLAAKTAELHSPPASVLGLDRPGVVWIGGEAIPIERSQGSKPVARLDRGRVLVGGPDAEAVSAIERWYRREAGLHIGETVHAEARLLGVRPGRISIRDQRTRWGSCSPGGSLSFSWRLLLMPPDVLDYVVVHELCHLEVLDHSRRFWRLVERARPDWRSQRDWLRVHAHEVGAYRPRLAAG